MNIPEAFAQAVAGKLSQGDLLKLFCDVRESSKEVREDFARMDRRDAKRELTQEEMSAAYKAGNAAMYAEGRSLD